MSLHPLIYNIAAAHSSVAVTLAHNCLQHRIMCKTVDTQYFIMHESTCTLLMIIFVHFKYFCTPGLPLLHAKIIATVQ